VIEVKATNISFDFNNMLEELADGRKHSVLLVYFPRLLNATARQRKNYKTSGEAYAFTRKIGHL
jgi:hypothetical protein